MSSPKIRFSSGHMISQYQMPPKIWASVLFALALVLVCVDGQTKTYSRQLANTTSQNLPFEPWNCPECWTPFGVPGPDDEVLLTNTVVLIDSAISLNALSINKSTVYCFHCTIQTPTIALSLNSELILYGSLSANIEVPQLDSASLTIVGPSNISGNVHGVVILQEISADDCIPTVLTINGNISIGSVLLESDNSSFCSLQVNGSILSGLAVYVQPTAPLIDNITSSHLNVTVVTYTGTATGFTYVLDPTSPVQCLCLADYNSTTGMYQIPGPCRMKGGGGGGPGAGGGAVDGNNVQPPSSCSSTYTGSGGFSILVDSTAKYTISCTAKCPMGTVTIGETCQLLCAPYTTLDANCNGHGKCVLGQTTNQPSCACNANYTSPDCSIRLTECPTYNGLVCNGVLSGQCNYTTLHCECVSDWTGSACQTPLCTPPCSKGSTCSAITSPHQCIQAAHGMESPSPTAAAHAPATPSSTWLFVPPPPGSVSGSCDQNDFAPDCITSICNGRTDVSCSNAGTCRTDKSPHYCVCLAGFQGSNCEQIVCNAASDCSGHGTCVPNRFPVQCECFAGFYGSTCSESADQVFSASTNSSVSAPASSKKKPSHLARRLIPVIAVVCVAFVLAVLAIVFRDRLALPKRASQKKPGKQGREDYSLLTVN